MRVAVPWALDPTAVTPPIGARHRIGGPTMGVSWSVDFVAAENLFPPKAQVALQSVLDGLLKEISHWDPASQLSRFNRAAAGEWMAFGPHLWAILARGLEIAAASGGAFDPAIGVLVDLWGFGPPGRRIQSPSAACVEDGLRVSGWRRLALDRDRRRVRQPGGLRLDLSAIGKGYGVDLMAAVLASLGVRDFLIDVGGELRGAGVKPDGQPWWVRIEPAPGEPEHMALTVALHDLAIATSGDYRIFLPEPEGSRRPHTLDPRTGVPVATEARSVSVLHASAMEADAACTILTVLPMQDAIDYACRHNLAARIVVEGEDGFVERFSPAFERLVA